MIGEEHLLRLWINSIFTFPEQWFKKQALDSFSLYVFVLCFCFVFSFCVFVLCFRFVFSFCVFALCFPLVFSFCVFALCFRFVFSFCVFVLCFRFVFLLCVFAFGFRFKNIRHLNLLFPSSIVYQVRKTPGGALYKI